MEKSFEIIFPKNVPMHLTPTLQITIAFIFLRQLLVLIGHDEFNQFSLACLQLSTSAQGTTT